MQLDVLCGELDLKPSEFDHILMVGGSTRIPAFQKSVKEYFGKEPLSEVNVDEAIALGASIYAGMKTKKENLNEAQKTQVESVKLQEKTNKNYGVIVIGDIDHERRKIDYQVNIILENNAPIPCERTDTIYTVSEGQVAVSCDITEDSFGSTNPKLVKTIHSLNLGPLPENRPEGQPIEVIYSFTSNQTLKCSFKDVNSNVVTEHELKIEGTSQEEIDESSKDLEKFILE